MPRTVLIVDDERDANDLMAGLVRARKDLVRTRLRLVQQLGAHLERVFPAAVDLFDDLASPIAVAFLRRFPSAERAAWLSPKRMAGWLAAQGQTIFHQRGSQESLGGVLQAMMRRLREGRSVGVFPEGRTRDGHTVGPFHARIFLAAVEAGVPVQPVALRYGEHGSAQTRVAFAPGESFFANFLRLLGEPACGAEVVFLPPIVPGDAEGRRRIAETARERIVAAMSP